MRLAGARFFKLTAGDEPRIAVENSISPNRRRRHTGGGCRG